MKPSFRLTLLPLAVLAMIALGVVSVSDSPAIAQDQCASQDRCDKLRQELRETRQEARRLRHQLRELRNELENLPPDSKEHEAIVQQIREIRRRLRELRRERRSIRREIRQHCRGCFGEDDAAGS